LGWHIQVGDLFTTASSIYGLNFWGSINNVSLPAISVPANSGSIYRITNTGITEAAELPNKGQGLGNICVDNLHSVAFVTNFYDGFIYRVDNAGGYTSWDPTFGNNATVYATAVPDLARIGQRPWGIAVSGTTVNNMKLYYARWSTSTSLLTGAHNEIWSVDLNAAGNIVTTSETLVYSIPFYLLYNGSDPVADIEISTDGTRMLLAERTMYGAGLSTGAHSSRLLEIVKNTGTGVWGASTNTFRGGGSSLPYNCAGGADYGETDLNDDKVKRCNATVFSMNDYTMVSGFLTYGVLVNNSTGINSEANGKTIDLDNINGNTTPSGAPAKTTLGDVDYRRCLTCPPPADTLCAYFAPGEVDSICCRACLRRIKPGGGAITSIGYTVTGGFVQGFISDCFILNPNSYSGTITGTITFSSPCLNLSSLCANLVSNTVSGNMTVTWVINFASGQQCTYQSSVKNCPHPKTRCDDFKYSQGNCTNGALCFVDFTITNQMVPNDPICKVKIEKFDNLGVLQTSYWNTGIGITPAATTYGFPWNLYPSVGSLSVPTAGVVHFQNYFPSPGPMTGYTILTVYHCSGDSCQSIFRPHIFNPGDLPNYETAKLLNVKPKFPKMFGTAYRLLPNAQTGRGLENLGVKYVSVGVVTVTTGTNPEIAAITGAEAYAEREQVVTKAISLHISKSGHGKQNAFFEFNNPIRLLKGDTSEYLHIIYADAPPVKVAYTMYGEDGGIISVDTANVETTTTTTVGLVDNKPQENEVFMIAGTPNPTAGVYQIRYANNKLQNINFVIYDAVGKMVMSVSEKNILEGVTINL
jgi:hypothetical protein